MRKMTQVKPIAQGHSECSDCNDRVSPLPRVIQSADCNSTVCKLVNLCSSGWLLGGWLGESPPISPSGLSFSVLLDIMRHKKEEAIISFGPKPRSSIIGTCFSLAGFHPWLLLEVRAMYGQTELQWWVREDKQEIHLRNETVLGRSWHFLHFLFRYADKSR